jgi:osmotically-inducible protein OsmY
MTTANKMSATILAALLVLSIPAIAKDSSPPATDVTAQFASGAFKINGLRAIEVGGIVVLRGKTVDTAEIARLSDFAHNLGYERVANVVSVIEVPDDVAIERRAERVLATQRSLDGCSFHVDSRAGVVNVAGRVQSELQKDLAINALRNIDGVREVHAELLQRQ